MSKLMPEVGDVWYDEGCREKLHITNVDKFSVSFLSKNEDRYFEYFCILNDIREFSKSYRYLGKSKANINQLFEVQDER